MQWYLFPCICSHAIWKLKNLYMNMLKVGCYFCKTKIRNDFQTLKKSVFILRNYFFPIFYLDYRSLLDLLFLIHPGRWRAYCDWKTKVKWNNCILFNYITYSVFSLIGIFNPEHLVATKTLRIQHFCRIVKYRMIFKKMLLKGEII